jgi:glycosidase
MKRKMLIPQILILILAVLLLGSLLISGCKETIREKIPPVSSVVHPEWSKNAVIYEVNLRQYTPEGTFEAFAAHLPRLKEMGVDILWFMPIHPIGELNRKGGLGSYYSVKDYKAVNPEFGDMDDFRALVEQAHELGMYVILDWVANHTAWDHAWVTEHPEYYLKDEGGNIVSPYDWSDVAGLDYNNEEMRGKMLDALKFWVSDTDIDGYRCDVAGLVPVDFWDRARSELDGIKKVFMLAEAEQPDHHVNAFDMSYAWELHHIMNDIAAGKKNTKDLDRYFSRHDSTFPADAYRMLFITNHDENSWNGTVSERLGDAAGTFAMLTFTLPGMPLLYSGQEAAMDKRLRFFDKDTIDWGDYELAGFYRDLIRLRKENPALWSGEAGGKMKRIKTTDDASVYAFIRRKDKDAVLVFANLSNETREFRLKAGAKERTFASWPEGETLTLGPETDISLSPWEYMILTGKWE